LHLHDDGGREQFQLKNSCWNQSFKQRNKWTRTYSFILPGTIGACSYSQNQQRNYTMQANCSSGLDEGEDGDLVLEP